MVPATQRVLPIQPGPSHWPTLRTCCRAYRCRGRAVSWQLPPERGQSLADNRAEERWRAHLNQLVGASVVRRIAGVCGARVAVVAQRHARLAEPAALRSQFRAVPSLSRRRQQDCAAALQAHVHLGWRADALARHAGACSRDSHWYLYKQVSRMQSSLPNAGPVPYFVRARSSGGGTYKQTPTAPMLTRRRC